jgi:serine/threonine protein kinase
MHLDLKPANMIYVKMPATDGVGGGFKKVLKIIDFGGSEFIPKELDQVEEKRANSCKIRKVSWRTEFYASPEQNCTKAGQYEVLIFDFILAYEI